MINRDKWHPPPPLRPLGHHIRLSRRYSSFPVLGGLILPLCSSLPSPHLPKGSRQNTRETGQSSGLDVSGIFTFWF